MALVKRKVFSFECSTLGDKMKDFIQDAVVKRCKVTFADGSDLPTDMMTVLSMVLKDNKIDLTVESANFEEIDENAIPVFSVVLTEV